MSSASAWAILAGTTLGVGLWSLVSLAPALRRPRLAERVAPYILDVSAEARSLVARRSVDPIPILGTLLAPAVSRLVSGFSIMLGGTTVVGRRLQQARWNKSVSEFRAEQLAWALAGLAAGTLVAAGAALFADTPLVVRMVLPLVGGMTAALLRDRLLERAARTRLTRMKSELPTVLEFLTLSLSAGEGILDSLHRVSATSSGELSAEFGALVADVHTGIPLAVALQSLSDRVQLPALTRCCDQVTGALERGSPLGEVLQAQAQDARDESKRDLLEVAGKKEVAMLVPLVFLILPVTIVYAIFPGLFVLQTGL